MVKNSENYGSKTEYFGVSSRRIAGVIIAVLTIQLGCSLDVFAKAPAPLLLTKGCSSSIKKGGFIGNGTCWGGDGTGKIFASRRDYGSPVVVNINGEEWILEYENGIPQKFPGHTITMECNGAYDASSCEIKITDNNSNTQTALPIESTPTAEVDIREKDLYAKLNERESDIQLPSETADIIKFGVIQQYSLPLLLEH